MECPMARGEFERSLPGVVDCLEDGIVPPRSAECTSSCVERRDFNVALIGQGPDELFGGTSASGTASVARPVPLELGSAIA